MRDIATKWLDWAAVYPMLKSAHDLIGPEVRLDTRKLYDVEGFEAAIDPRAENNSLRSFIDARRAFLLERTAPGGAALQAAAAENFRPAAN